MNLEILAANIKTDETYTFTFSKPIDQFMIGFSKCSVQYSRPDHHVREITINITDVKRSNNLIIVKPQLRINDSSGHRQSSKSSVTIVVLATVGDGNHDIQLFSEIKGHFKNELTVENPTFVKSTLLYSHAQYPNDDHHVYKYASSINALVKQGSYILRGQTILRDHHSEHDVEDGLIFGSTIIFNGHNQKVLFANFKSSEIGAGGNVYFGNANSNINLQDYSLACFIDGFDVSFKEGNDHHVLKIQLGVSLAEGKLFVDEGKICAKVNLKSYLSDNSENKFNIPHNSISGFVIAFNSK